MTNIDDYLNQYNDFDIRKTHDDHVQIRRLLSMTYGTNSILSKTAESFLANRLQMTPVQGMSTTKFSANH